MTRAGLAVVTLALGVVLPGCGSAPKPRVVGVYPDSCAFEPVAIVVHPLTRLVLQPEKEPRIDAHIEFRDAAGDEVKAVGALVIELFRGSGPFMGEGMRQQVLRWETNLSDMEENSRAYDRVTRTYRFELTGPADALDEKSSLRLRATLTRDKGREIADEVPLER